MKGYNTRSVWIISAEIRYLLSEQKKFQNKSKNIDEVYQSVFFRCMLTSHFFPTHTLLLAKTKGFKVFC